MPEIVIIDLNVLNKEEIADYQKLAPITIKHFNGKFLVRGGKVIPLEGNWNSERLVVIEFPTIERAEEWWNSDLYSKAKSIRQKAAKTRMIIVEGI